jgi:leucyl aminopeptidase (aminopeptidase T)
MSESLTTDELLRLVESVFRPGPEDRSLALLVDLPDAVLADHAAWAARRAMAADWHARLLEAGASIGLDRVSLVFYRNVRSNNADLPEQAFPYVSGSLPARAEALDEQAGTAMAEVLSEHRLLIAPTELSATAPLKLNARRYGFRAATMPGFGAEMMPALRLDYEEIQRRCSELKAKLDTATAAHICFEAEGKPCELTIDLRHRQATASGGLVREPGRAGNLPSGETYIVPYEGEVAGDPSRTRGVMPLQLEGELMHYRIEGNRVREVLGQGPAARRERIEIEAEPAYSNLAELGFGLLADYDIQPVGQILLDEKLGLHIALGRSDHFGGQTGAADFSSPDKVVHIDRVYIPKMQPAIAVRAVDLEPADLADSSPTPLMRDGRYVNS